MLFRFRAGLIVFVTLWCVFGSMRAPVLADPPPAPAPSNRAQNTDVRRAESQARNGVVTPARSVGQSSNDAAPDTIQSNQVSGPRDLLNGKGVTDVVGMVIRFIIGLVGALFLWMIVYGGWIWRDAAGDPKMTTRAITTIRNAVIGVVIVIFSYTIVVFLLDTAEQLSAPQQEFVNDEPTLAEELSLNGPSDLNSTLGDISATLDGSVTCQQCKESSGCDPTESQYIVSCQECAYQCMTSLSDAQTACNRCVAAQIRSGGSCIDQDTDTCRRGGCRADCEPFLGQLRTYCDSCKAEVRRSVCGHETSVEACVTQKCASICAGL